MSGPGFKIYLAVIVQFAVKSGIEFHLIFKQETTLKVRTVAIAGNLPSKLLG